MHNNELVPDSAIIASITDSEWSRDYKQEILLTRKLGETIYLLVSIPHFIYGFQRYDLVEVEPKTDLITKLIYRSRNTSVRIVFNDIKETSKQSVLESLVNIGCVIDPSNINLIGIDLDKENSREAIKEELNKFLGKEIADWEYVVQDI